MTPEKLNPRMFGHTSPSPDGRKAPRVLKQNGFLRRPVKGCRELRAATRSFTHRMLRSRRMGAARH